MKNELALFAGLTLSTIAFAQQGPGGPPPGEGGGPPNPQEMRQRMSERMKQELGTSDKEWQTLEGKIDAVRQLRRDASGGPMFGPGPGGPGGPGGPVGGGFGGPGGPNNRDNNGPPPSGDRPQRDQGERPQGERGRGDQNRQPPPPQDQNRQPSAVEQASRDLREAVDNDAAPEQLQQKMAALRDARKDAKVKLAKAQDELKGLVTARQEAVLVRMGFLE